MTGINTDAIRAMGAPGSLFHAVCDEVEGLRAENEMLRSRKCVHDGGLPPYDRVRVDRDRFRSERDAALARVAELEAENANLRNRMQQQRMEILALRAVVRDIRDLAEDALRHPRPNRVSAQQLLDLIADLDAVPVQAPMPEARETACCNAQPQCAECSPLWRDTTEAGQ